ncbi:CoA-disulfide reductase [Bacillus sp. 2205SS5-2]|uniref:CoA-disulfide reductase n=1 Tax=Bacillus sp. 2205SS5-2 TaxID=3109031 RepID=UPI00300580B0
MEKKIVIVGGVAGGATAAARIRRIDENAKIVMFEKGEYISFANCGLPYHIGGVIPKRESLLVQTVEGMNKKFNLDIRNLTEVIKINRDQKTVTVQNVQNGLVYEESYDKLILSPGARPIVPSFAGLPEAKNVFTLRNVPDTDRIKTWVDQKKPKRAVVVGGGFIGLEMAENLHHRGLEVTVIELGSQVMAPLDPEMAAMVHQHLRDKDVNLILEDGVKEFKENGKKVILCSGKELESDITILSIGVRPENELAERADLDIGKRGGIIVNEHLQTKDQDIYAIGDAIEVKDYILGIPTMVPLAWPANRQGRLVADHIDGRKASYKGTLGTAVAKVFDLTVAVTGNNGKTLQNLDVPFEAVHVHPNSNASYYPGGSPISLKLTFHPESGQIYGVQGVGVQGVEKRIDVIATAIKGGLSVQDLPDLELAYAPPYSSAKDPVNMLGYVATNIVDQEVQVVHYNQIDEIVENGGFLIDVREPIERELGFIPGSINLPLGEIRDKVESLPKDQPIFVTCQVGLRGYLATRILQQYGFTVFNVSGGFKTYNIFTRDQQERLVEETTNKTLEMNEPKEIISSTQAIKAKVQLNCTGLQCPGPITEVYKCMNTMNEGETLEIKVTDPGFTRDIIEWCAKTGNTFLHQSKDEKTFSVFIQKGIANLEVAAGRETSLREEKGATLVVFDQDYDKAIASFIIATGAAAMGKKVTMFFTFWGLNILRKEASEKQDKEFMDKIFGAMMPSGPKKLPISNMNFGGAGAKMIQKVMKNKNVDNLETLMASAIELGVEIVACSMSMDVMGIRQEELIDGIEIGGVATYLGKAEDSNINLFV